MASTLFSTNLSIDCFLGERNKERKKRYFEDPSWAAYAAVYALGVKYFF